VFGRLAERIEPLDSTLLDRGKSRRGALPTAGNFLTEHKEPAQLDENPAQQNPNVSGHPMVRGLHAPVSGGCDDGKKAGAWE
jgi:hypothetical protein